MSYSQILIPRPEVLSDQGIDGIIDLANLFSRRRALEKDAERFLALTYPTGDIRRVLEELDCRFSSEKATSGLFLFEGLKGTGKSHLLLLIYHLLQNQKAGREWLRKHNIQCGLPDDATVVLNKFTDFPLVSIWDFILEKLNLPRTEKVVVQPGQGEIDKLLSGRRLILILDELEQGIRCINDPTVRDQNIAFLQMLSEWGNRSNQVTLFASIYSVEEEPGATLKRVPCCRIHFTQFEDRERVVLHRIFENADKLDQSKVDSAVDSYVNVWRRKASVPDTLVSNFRNSYPFTADLMDLMLRRVPARGGFQNVRGALGFLGHMVRLTYGKADIVSSANASLEDRDIRTWLSDLDVSADLIEKVRTDSANVGTRFLLASQIGASVFLYTVTSPTGSRQRGCSPDELKREVLGPDTDINDFENTIAAFEKFGAHFHFQEGRYYFDKEEQPDAKVEFRSLNVPDPKARELLRQIWVTDVFRDDGSTVLYSDAETTRRQLGELDKSRLRFVLAPRRLTAAERHELFNGLESRNLVVLLEPKDATFDLDRNPDLMKWAKRQVAAQELTIGADAERRAAYERIQRQDRGHCVSAIRRAGQVLIRWEKFGASASEDACEEEIVSGRELSRADVTQFLSTDLFPEQRFVDHLSDRLESLYGQTVRVIERDYQQVLGYPIPVGEMVLRALKGMCANSRIGLRHSRENTCGKTPTLTVNELRDATVDAPFVEGPGAPPLPFKSQPPEIPQPPPIPGEQPPAPPRTIVQDVSCLPKQSAGEIRIEIASRLASLKDFWVQEVIFKIFFESDAGDLSSLPTAFRGSLSGSGAVTADIQIKKQGRFSKAEVEQMAEALPAYAGARYSANLKVVITQEEAQHV
jgi:hypothetical protein